MVSYNIYRIGSVPPLPWTDTELPQLTAPLVFPKDSRKPRFIKLSLIRFFNFYFYGKRAEYTMPHQVVFPILSYLPFDPTSGKLNEYFFPEEKFGNEAFFKLPPECPEIDNFEHWLATSAQYGYSTGKTLKQTATIKEHYTGKSFSSFTFKAHIHELLTDFAGEKLTQSALMLIKIAAYLALFLCRSFVKDAAQMNRAFNKRTVLDDLTKYTAWPIQNGFSPPCKECIDACVLEMNKGFEYSRNMMTLILYQWEIYVKLGSCPAQSLLQDGLLTDLRGNGMGLVVLMMKASEALGCTFSELRDHTLLQSTKMAWDFLDVLIAEHLRPDNYSLTFLWARLVNDRYFIPYNCSYSPLLCGIFGGILSTCEIGGSIKDAAWYKKKTLQAERGFKIGVAVVAKFAEDKERDAIASTVI